MKKRQICSVAFLIAIGGLLLVGTTYWPPDKGVSSPTTTFRAEYDEPAEGLIISVDGGEPLTAEMVETVRILRFDDGTSRFVEDGIELHADDERLNGTSWAATSGESVTTLPLEREDTVRVQRVGTDRDGDGRYGVEPGDEVLVVVELDQVTATIARFAIDRDGDVANFDDGNTTTIPRTERPIYFAQG